MGNHTRSELELLAAIDRATDLLSDVVGLNAGHDRRITEARDGLIVAADKAKGGA